MVVARNIYHVAYEPACCKTAVQAADAQPWAVMGVLAAGDFLA